MLVGILRNASYFVGGLCKAFASSFKFSFGFQPPLCKISHHTLLIILLWLSCSYLFSIHSVCAPLIKLFGSWKANFAEPKLIFLLTLCLIHSAMLIWFFIICLERIYDLVDLLSSKGNKWQLFVVVTLIYYEHIEIVCNI